MTYDTINDAVTRAGGVGALLMGRYRIVRLLGHGGMGSVWLAEDTQLDNKLFAIKMLPSILVSNKRAYAQLKKEALVAMTLSHTNIVTVRAFEENNGNPFLVMDYIDGETLDDHLAEKGKLSEDEALRVLRPIAAALDYAHTKGVIHRDVKPGNVMIAKDGTPFILDFGIAREIQETMTRVTGKLSSGTLLYMSPEQLMGEDPSAAQDVYSFAAMAYECLKGKPPFAHGQIEFQIMNKLPDPLPTEGLTGKASILVVGVMAGLAKKPEDRPATCTAVLEGDNLTQRRREAELQSGRARSPSGPQSGGPRSVAADDAQPGRARSPSAPQGDDNVRVEHVERVDDLGGARRPAEPVGRRVPTPPQPKGPLHDHKGVQLWDGGPYWAETNIGAEKPEDYGYYFWWGDTVGYKRENGVWVASDGSASGFAFYEKYTPTYDKNLPTLKSEGWIIGGEERISFWGKLFGSSGPRESSSSTREDSVLATEHDAARVHWGEKWRMPTIQELGDLFGKCDWKWVSVNGVNGYVVRGRGNYETRSIFLPCAGDGYGTSLNGAGSHGHYWSSVPYSDYYYDAWGLCFKSSYRYPLQLLRYSRFYGQSVRPVQGFAK